MIEELQTRHRSAVENILFANPSGETPPWLVRQAEACSSQYGGFRLIPEFRSALNAFSDNTFKPFELFVLGEGKFGKSTLVNAMLGEERSKSRGLPETRCFLRYVITDHPRSSSRMFLRLQRGTHDWIRAKVSHGKAVPDLFEIDEYDVDGEVAGQILREEASRLDGGNYAPAVYEAERDHKKTSRCIFPSGVRIVDTQGLDQLFPDDLQKLGRNSDDPDITRRFLDWMSNTPRGKHLEWQFRRCDAVLWCVNAKRIGSAATEASMKYFSSYSKKIIIALTNIDLVARKDGDVERLLKKAQEKYGHFARVILPVNGQLALESAIAEDLHGIHKSGLAALAEALTKVCVLDAAKTRSTSRYFGLRKTETQFRNALSQLESELSNLLIKHRADIKLTDREKADELQAMSQWLDKQIKSHTSEVIAKIYLINLSDDRNSCMDKMGVSAMSSGLQNLVGSYFHKTLVPRILHFVGQIKPYKLPLFDAEGERCGDICAIDVEISRPSTPALTLWLRVSLEDELFTRAQLWFRKKMLGFFSEQAKQSALAEEQRLIYERQEYVFREFTSQWGKCVEEWVTIIFQQYAEMYSPIYVALAQIKDRVESFEEEPIEATVKKINVALKSRGANMAFQGRFLSVFKSRVSANVSAWTFV